MGAVSHANEVSLAKESGTSSGHVVFMIGESGHGTHDSLPQFFRDVLAPRGFTATFVFAPTSGPGKHSFPGLVEALEDADLLVISVRRRAPRRAQLEAIRRYLDRGKPLVALRTSSHAFAAKEVPSGHAAWPDFDSQVLGGSYSGLHGDTLVRVSPAGRASNHPILNGVQLTRTRKLYKAGPLAKDATPLLVGKTRDEAPEPLAWVRLVGKKRSRVFYTSMGLGRDFASRAYQRLLLNAVRWSLDRGTDDNLEGEEAPVHVTLNVAQDLDLDLVLSDPKIANPLYINFDERGRLWLVEYRQYPWPAGLRLLSRDKVWRNVYEPPYAPPPPYPEGSPFRGADRISIHEDRDGDGKFETSKIFIEGLNLATAALRGRGGVFIMQPPYLLFYADRDDDDVPDSLTPDVLLSGFGIEDTHSIASSLRWGPDGWIYGAQGSTVSAAVVPWKDRKPVPGATALRSMGQHIWRYHPESRRYEIFAEGGGNTFGVEVDHLGHVFSGHNGGNTRGFHYVQGGYSRKTFGKHGELSNPHAFNYFRAMQHHNVQRFTHTFTIYDAKDLPERYHGRMIAPSPILNVVYLSDVQRRGATFRTKDLFHMAKAGPGARDRFFSPVDAQYGPDGYVYLADWHAMQIAHIRNHNGESNPELGRVYRLRTKGAKPSGKKHVDLGRVSSRELVDVYLAHENRWFRQTALRVLGDRRDMKVTKRLLEIVRESKGQHALEALWALFVSGVPLESFLDMALGHENPEVRRWGVRLVGETPEVRSRTAARLAEMAHRDPNVDVRCQLAATARRIPTGAALPILAGLIERNEDTKDLFLPLMIWWALEAHADDHDDVLRFVSDPKRWKTGFEIDEGFDIIDGLMRRYAAIGTRRSLLACAKLIELCPDKKRLARLMKGFGAAFEGRPLPPLPNELATRLSKVEGHFGTLIAVRRGDASAVDRALAVLVDAKADAEKRKEFAKALSDVSASPERVVDALFRTAFDAKNSESLRNTALSSLQKFSDPKLGERMLKGLGELPDSLRATAEGVLASRSTWSLALLEAALDGEVDIESLDAEARQRLFLHRDARIRDLVKELLPESKERKESLERRALALANLVRTNRGGNRGGVPKAGQKIFHEKAGCGKCHRIFEKGGDIGPDLSSYDRSRLDDILLAVIQPSAEIREGFDTRTVLTRDGRVLTGFQSDGDDNVLVLKSTDGQNVVIPRTDIVSLEVDKRSIMPEGLLDKLTEKELLDLFAFLQSTTPPY
ncbi:MAG: PVC-type heme-binding CxxCH protein [Planctomycetota bacterium]